VAGWAHRAFGNRWLRWLIGGVVFGAVALTVVLLLRGREHDTLVLEVQPVGDPNAIRVYVGGAVATPGLYTLPRGSRVAEALDAAGGVDANADTSKLGLAARLDDADQVIVPERRPAQATASAAQPTLTQPPSQGGGDGTAASAAAAIDPTPATAGPVDVNNASASELEALPGIGPAIAQRIIDYRETNGPFQAVEELAEVRGISDAMVEELRPLITLGP
jgi:competence protein ComEA